LESKKPSGSQSGKSSSSIRSAKSAASRKLPTSLPVTSRPSKVGHVRGPRPPPTSLRIQYEGSWGRN
jgi:hypothetical protein